MTGKASHLLLVFIGYFCFLRRKTFTCIETSDAKKSEESNSSCRVVDKTSTNHKCKKYVADNCEKRKFYECEKILDSVCDEVLYHVLTSALKCKKTDTHEELFLHFVYFTLIVWYINFINNLLKNKSRKYLRLIIIHLRYLNRTKVC